MNAPYPAAGEAARPAHAPDDHPRLPPARTGVLLANLGTPDATNYWSMRRYLNEFLSDRRVIDYPAWKWQPILQGIILTKRPFTSGANYRKIWDTERNESPLLTITRAQTEGLRERLVARFGDRVRVEFCMRYGNPATADVLRRMLAEGCRRVLFFPLYPQYAGATTATACDQLFRALMREPWQPPVRVVEAYGDDPAFIAALAASVRRGWAEAAEAFGAEPERLVVSYHGMPERYLTQGGDPYHCQCRKTSRLLREALGWPEGRMVTTFQSRFGREEWLKPYTAEEVARLAREEGVRRIAVVAPAFAADCVETLEEIRGEVAESFEEAGGHGFHYIPCLNDDPAHLDALEGIILRNLGGWL
ncbi:ferrochelatase [Rubellimicrobium sp. CFH 75288]|uniref:ferrochelatase n=1 Tax=Rubellimicrobium sp. CFH 75288 TaxID=2697034 RepID=UPI0014126433|nr:ferrochelatase [Rubellimicrobium sp. CFH 75288]NAZ37747.1 ferrochelatase [Rubellimicrobium sp. CFH 75288]